MLNTVIIIRAIPSRCACSYLSDSKHKSKLPSARKAHHVLRVDDFLQRLQPRQIVPIDLLQRRALDRIVRVRARTRQVLAELLRLRHQAGRRFPSTITDGFVRERERPSEVDVRRQIEAVASGRVGGAGRGGE
jgi:hypothetical protein